MAKAQHQAEVQAIAGLILEEAISRLSNAGVSGPDIAQAMILTGSGLLAGSLGPKGAGLALREVADTSHAWMQQLAEALEQKAN